MISIFLAAYAIGFSGAVMPGPLLTYTIKQALNCGPRAGFIIIIGHALLELLLIGLIFLGFDVILQSVIAQIIIGIVGGILLIYMGGKMVYDALKKRIKIELDNNKVNTRNMMISGAVISAASPYFIIWWAIIGLGLLLQAYKSFGVTGVLIFYIGHICADFTWYGALSLIIGKTRKFISERLYYILIIGLGVVLIYFGGSFCYKALINLL